MVLRTAGAAGGHKGLPYEDRRGKPSESSGLVQDGLAQEFVDLVDVDLFAELFDDGGCASYVDFEFSVQVEGACAFF